jgi:hypothetical protein
VDWSRWPVDADDLAREVDGWQQEYETLVEEDIPMPTPALGCDWFLPRSSSPPLQGEDHVRA